MPESEKTPSDHAIEREDGPALAKAASLEELQRLKAAEELLEIRWQRRQRRSRVGIASQYLVGFVAVAGFFVNAYQSYANKQQQQHQAGIDQERWNREFERASQADKYRAFFETSVLATDPSNPDKRLVGYALLQEFVQDKEYNQKATLMLEESLSQELRGNTTQGLDEEHGAAVRAILTALSQTNDCRSLERAARSVDRLARRHAQVGDVEETGEVMKVYIRRLLGRAARVCGTLKDFRAVRRPIRDTLLKNPELLGARRPLRVPEANARVATTLRERCQDEISVSGATDCPEILEHYGVLCGQLAPAEMKEEGPACEVIRAAVSGIAQASRAP